MMKDKVLFFGRKEWPKTNLAEQLLRDNFSTVDTILSGSPVEQLPDSIKDWRGDYIFSMRSYFILPGELLKAASKLSLNFHPGPPEFPGIACANFALFTDSPTYGVTCHRMTNKVDSGEIIAAERFPIYDKDTIETLLERTHDQLFLLFKHVINTICTGKMIEPIQEKWTGNLTTRKDFENLYHIPVDIEQRDLMKRIRSTSYRDYQPYIEIHGQRFFLKG